MPVLIPGSGPVDLTGPGVPGTILHPGQASLGEITLGVVDEFGVEWILEEVDGWDDPASTTGAANQRAADHGGWLSPAFYTPRTIELKGALFADTWDGASLALDRLWGAVPLDTPDWLYVAEGARTLCARVRQDGDPLNERNGGWCRFSLSLVAADPRRYAVDETTASTGLPATSGGMVLPLTLPLTVGATVTAGVLSLTNAGNMASPWVGTVTGPVSAGASITHRGSGKTLRIAADVAAGRVLTIDSDRRRALLDGTAARVVTGSWFDLAPGSNDIAFSAPTASAGTLGFTFRSAWK